MTYKPKKYNAKSSEQLRKMNLPLLADRVKNDYNFTGAVGKEAEEQLANLSYTYLPLGLATQEFILSEIENKTAYKAKNKAFENVENIYLAALLEIEYKKQMKDKWNESPFYYTLVLNEFLGQNTEIQFEEFIEEFDEELTKKFLKMEMKAVKEAEILVDRSEEANWVELLKDSAVLKVVMKLNKSQFLYVASNLVTRSYYSKPVSLINDLLMKQKLSEKNYDLSRVSADVSNLAIDSFCKAQVAFPVKRALNLNTLMKAYSEYLKTMNGKFSYSGDNSVRYFYIMTKLNESAEELRVEEVMAVVFSITYKSALISNGTSEDIIGILEKSLMHKSDEFALSIWRFIAETVLYHNDVLLTLGEFRDMMEADSILDIPASLLIPMHVKRSNAKIKPLIEAQKQLKTILHV